MIDDLRAITVAEKEFKEGKTIAHQQVLKKLKLF